MPSTILSRSEGEGLATLRRAPSGADVTSGASAAQEEPGFGYDDDFGLDVEGYEADEGAPTAEPTEPLQVHDEEQLHGGTQVVYLRENVAVWPSSRQCILGRLSLVKQARVLFIAWLPYGRSAPSTAPASTAKAVAKATTQLSHSERVSYALHPLPLSEVRALRCRTPLLLVASLVLVLQDGLSLPPLHFHAGGLQELIKCLKKHLSVKHAAGQKGVLLVQDMADPLPRALATSPELEEAIGLRGGSVREGQSASAASAAVNEGVEGCEGAGRMAVAAAQAAVDAAAAVGGEVAPAVGGQARVSHAASVAADSNQHGVQDIDINDNTGGGGGGGDGNGATPWALWLRGVQRRVRAAAAAVASSAAADYASWQEALAEGDVAAAAFYSQLDFETSGAAAAAAAVASPASPTPAIVTSASGDCMVVLQQAPAAAQAATGSVFVCHAAAAPHAVVGTSAGPAPAAAAQGRAGSAGLAGSESLLNRQQTAKLQAGLQEEAEDDAASCSSTVSVDGFELVSPSAGSSSAAGLLRQHSPRVQLPPLTSDEWQALFDTQGRLVGLDMLRQRVFCSGIDPAVRPEAWKFLLGLYPAHSTEDERQQLLAKRRKEYQALRMQWESISPAQASRNDHWRERCTRINKDARRTDRHLPFYATEKGPNVAALRRILLTYAVYDFNLGYCQGMSDLASPLLYVLCDEVEAFWCFVALMERIGPHFDDRQSGVQAQLKALGTLLQALDPPLHAHLSSLDALSYFFCFRWLLVLFKREFRLEEVLRLWEAVWACPFTGQLPVHLAAAVLVHHRRDILEHTADLDALLRLCCQLQGKLQLEPLLLLAERLAGYAAAAGVDVAATEGLPAPPPLSAANAVRVQGRA